MTRPTNSSNEYLESRVLSAGPVGLIEILYERALESVTSARHFLTTGDIGSRGREITRAQAILAELANCLDSRSGGEISHNLARLYEYSQQKLSRAHRFGTDEDLNEVQGILTNMLTSWRGVSAPSHSDPVSTAENGFHGERRPTSTSSQRSWTF